jgi:hypothetical protein
MPPEPTLPPPVPVTSPPFPKPPVEVIELSGPNAPKPPKLDPFGSFKLSAVAQPTAITTPDETPSILKKCIPPDYHPVGRPATRSSVHRARFARGPR